MKNILMKVKVHRNLNAKCLSITATEGEFKGRVIAHCQAVRLLDVTFKVSETSRQRILRTRVKDVHAYAVGYLVECDTPVLRYPQPLNHTDIECGFERRITYNPFKLPYFHDSETLEVVEALEQTVITTGGLFAEKVACAAQKPIKPVCQSDRQLSLV